MDDNNNLFDKVIEMGLGMSIANQIPKMMNSVIPNQDNKQGQTPPAINSSGVQFYASINNGQAGPFSEQEFIVLIQKGHVTKDTLVWKAGMSTWQPASQVPETGKLLLLYSDNK